MTATGGPLESVSFGGRELAVTVDSDPTVVMGGIEIAIEMNGNFTHRELRTPVPWSISSAKVTIDIENGDHEYLVNFQKKGGGEIIITYAGSISYTGNGNITGTIEVNPATASATLSAGGSGMTKKI